MMNDMSKFRQMNISFPPFYDFFEYYKYAEPISIPPQWHKELEFLFCTKGRHQLLINGEEHLVEEKDIIIVNPYISHSHVLKPEGDLLSLTISVQFLDFNGFKTKGGRFREVCRDNKLWNLFKDFYITYYALDELREPKLRSKLIDMLVYVFENHYIPDNSYSENHKINQILEYLDSNYAEKITLESLSQKFHYNKCYLAASFKKHVGRTLIEYVNLKRCTYADDLLKTTDLKVADIAEMCGFGSLSNFSKRYKRFRGRSPSDVRNRSKNLAEHIGRSSVKEDFGE